MILYSAFNLLLFLGLSLSTNGRSFVEEKWSRSYKTHNSTDLISSISLDAGNGYFFIVGRTNGPRSLHSSFQGLLYEHVFLPKLPVNASLRQDGIIAKISKYDGRLLWATRLSENKDTRLSAVSISPDRKTVYAVGVMMKSPDNLPFIMGAFDPDDGKAKGSLFVANTRGVYFIMDVIAHSDGIYICGKTTVKNGSSLESSEEPAGGVLVASVSITGSLVWLKRAGSSLDNDLCSGIALSVDEKTLYIATTQQLANPSSLSLSKSVIYSVSASRGRLLWKSRVPNPPNSGHVSTNVIVKDDAVFASSSFWSDRAGGQRSYLHKMSEPRGTFLWSKQTCCGELSSIVSDSVDYDGKGSVVSVPGLFFGEDRYVYHSAYVRLRKDYTDDRYGTLILRMGMYGEHTSAVDQSLPVTTFKIVPAEPQRLEMSFADRSIFIVSNSMVFSSSTDLDTTNPHVSVLQFEAHNYTGPFRQQWGKFYTKVSIRLILSTISAGAVHDLFAEYLRVTYNQTSFSSTPVDDTSSTTMASINMTVYGEEFLKLYENVLEDVEEVFQRSGESKKNRFETHFGLEANSVRLVEGSINRIEEGVSASIVANGNSDGEGNQDNVSGHRNPTSRGIDWKKIGFCLGGLFIFVAAVAGIAVAANYKSGIAEESFSSTLHGRPNENSDIDVVYYNTNYRDGPGAIIMEGH